ncbi:MAG: RNA-binding domain-containing protein [Thermoplasmatota archaeon]
MTFHYIEFKTYCHATEDIEKVKDILYELAGEDIEIEISEAEGYYGNPIEILETTISRNRDMDEFFKKITEDIVQDLLDTVERRVDERCNFFFRLDKEARLDDGLVLSDGENTVKVRARVESYPAKRSSAIEILKKYLKGLIKE